MGNKRYSPSERRWKNYGPESQWYQNDQRRTEKWQFMNSPAGQKWKQDKIAKGEWQNFSDSSGNGK
jgi:hypothetical protein